MFSIIDECGITKYEKFLCNLLSIIKGKHKLPKYIIKLSKRKYGAKDNLARYFTHKYLNISVGKYTYGYEQLVGQGTFLESIGDFCSIAVDVRITGGNHPTQYITTHPILTHKRFGFCDEDGNINKVKNKKVTICNDVWIGTNVMILPSVKIGNGAIIAAGAVITKNVPDYAIVGGIPAKVIRYRFTQEEITRLNEIKWWEWSEEKIRDNINLFSRNDDFFCKFADL